MSIFLRAFLPPMLHNGVAFECHPQNCVARFDIETKELKGFIVRDFGGLKVHRPTLKASTGVDMDFIEGHSIIASSLDDVYTRMYHTIIHNHFQQLIRVLDLHYNGLGWEVVRQQLRTNIPREHPLYDAWLSPSRTSLPGKCFMRMRMSSMYRFVSLMFFKGFRVPHSKSTQSISMALSQISSIIREYLRGVRAGDMRTIRKGIWSAKNKNMLSYFQFCV